MSKNSFFASVASLVSDASDTDSSTLAGDASSSTVTLIPKGTSSGGAPNQSQSGKAPEKDCEASFAKPASDMGFTGIVPTLSPCPQPMRKSDGKKAVPVPLNAKTGSQSGGATSSTKADKKKSSSITLPLIFC